MSATAKIVRFHETGAAEVLKIEELPLQEPGPGEVRIRVKAIGLNRAETLFRYGYYLDQPVLPSKIGTEAAGTIEAIGPDVDAVWMGRAVSTVPGAFRMNEYGVYGEVAVIPVHAVAEFPARLSFEQGAAIWMQYLTAYGALIWLGKIVPKEVVLITAASSSVGLAAIELVKAEGAISIAVTRTATKKDQLLKLGADHVIVTDDEDLVSRVNEITSGKGARIIFDPIGGKIVDSLAQATSPKGIIFEYGALAINEPTPYPLLTCLAKQLTIRAFAVAEMTFDPIFPEAKKYVFDRLASGAFEPVIGKTFPLAQIVESHQYMESNAQIGKIVVTV
jgi:NADPH:quinone reductase-like Zn-dependent oxidoreductase